MSVLFTTLCYVFVLRGAGREMMPASSSVSGEESPYTLLLSEAL